MGKQILWIQAAVYACRIIAVAALIFILVVTVDAHGQELSVSQQIALKEAELSALKKQNAMAQAPMMYAAMTEMVKASSKCVSDSMGSKGRLTRTASVSKACREQAQLGAFAICATTVSQTGDTRDLNQCTAMMQDNGQWQQVWMRGLGVAGAYLGGQLAADVVLKGAVPLGLAAISKEPTAPVIVEQPEPIIVQPAEPIIVEPIIITDF